jgi:intergrase/recombinase
MGNMSYCRFENTLRDLEDCHSALNRIYDEVNEMSKYEKNAVVELVDLCKIISHEWAVDEIEEIIKDAETNEDN